MKMNNMNLNKINKLKYELIDDLSDSQVELLVESMITDKYCMDKDELLSNEIGLIDVLQYLIDTGKIVLVLNGVYGAYNQLLYNMNFKGFDYDVQSNGKFNGLKGLAKAFDNSKELFQENKQLKKENQELKNKLDESKYLFKDKESYHKKELKEIKNLLE